MTGSLAPALLLSMPQLTDPNFNRTVVLLCKHSDEEGAFGLVVNRPLVTSGRVVVNLDPPVSTDHELEVWVGGPVEPHRSWMLVGGTRRAARRSTCRSPSGSTCRRRRICCGGCSDPDPPPRTRLMVGYSGWGPGQLEAELEASAWLMSDVDPDLIFDTPPDQMWETAIRRLGADPGSLQMWRGVH